MPTLRSINTQPDAQGHHLYCHLQSQCWQSAFSFSFFPVSGFFFFSFGFWLSVRFHFKSNVMMYPMVRCYHEGAVLPPHSFFILCKGCNAGKPGFKPWTNSFMAVCPNQQCFDFYFRLVYGLFQSGKFKTRHRGSAIPFINLNDVRDVISEVAPLIHPDWSRYQEIFSSLDKLRKLKATLAEQIVATEKLLRYLLQKYFLEIKKASK